MPYRRYQELGLGSRRRMASEQGHPSGDYQKENPIHSPYLNYVAQVVHSTANDLVVARLLDQTTMER